MLKSIGMVCLTSLLIAGILGSVCLADSDPIAYWAFDEGNGKTVKDLSGKNNGGDIMGNIEWEEEGKYGSALNFDGLTGYVNVPDAESLQITDAITIAVWVNPQPSAGGGAEAFIVSKYAYASGQGYSYGIWQEAPYFKWE